MARRRRNFRKKNWGKPRERQSGRNTKKVSLKERVLTVVIWALGLINVVLIASLVSDFFASPHEKPASMNLANEAKSEPTPVEPQPKIITVEVLNGCGVPGLAHAFTEFLRKNDFDVVNVGNSESGFNLEKTYVVDRISLNNENAKKVARALGINDDQVQPQMDPSRQLMVTVYIGKDYKKLKAYSEILRISKK